MTIANILSWFEKVGTLRAAEELRRMGYPHIAESLLKNQ